MENKLYDRVREAQLGDKEAMTIIIQTFIPAISQAKYKATRNERDDIQQAIIEMMIKKVLSYDLSQTLNYSAFCRQVSCKNDPVFDAWERID